MKEKTKVQIPVPKELTTDEEIETFILKELGIDKTYSSEKMPAEEDCDGVSEIEFVIQRGM